jgi:hypothetical protein
LARHVHSKRKKRPKERPICLKQREENNEKKKKNKKKQKADERQLTGHNSKEKKLDGTCFTGP